MLSMLNKLEMSQQHFSQFNQNGLRHNHLTLFQVMLLSLKTKRFDDNFKLKGAILIYIRTESIDLTLKFYSGDN